MAIFGRSESKKEKKQQKINKEVEEYLSLRGIDSLDPKYNELVSWVAGEMKVNNILKMPLMRSEVSYGEHGIINYLSAQIEQNWIIIKQQDDILKELKKLNNK